MGLVEAGAALARPINSALRCNTKHVFTRSLCEGAEGGGGSPHLRIVASIYLPSRAFVTLVNVVCSSWQLRTRYR